MPAGEYCGDNCGERVEFFLTSCQKKYIVFLTGKGDKYVRIY